MNSYLVSLGPSLANHLWQSTAFAVVVWLLTLALRKNHARVRYSLWLAAAIKFLIPFSLLVSAGNLLPHPKQPVVPVIYSAMDVVEEPFAAVIPPAAPLIHVPTPRERAAAILPSCLGFVWLIGVGTVLFGWWNRWRVVSASVHQATPAIEGRELETLRQLEARISEGPPRRPLPLLISPTRMEPGIFGVFRPVLLWPDQLSERLDDEHVEAILAHELTHIRRRDHLTSLIHMFVEAVFWFYPLVWWMERQMVKEREQACDEAVVERGSDAETYAESLLKTCRFCVESPLPCVAGVTGADLKKRVFEIVSGRTLVRMTWPKKLLLAATAVCVVAAPVAFGVVKMIPLYGQILHADGPLPSFEVATIRPLEGMRLPPPPGGAGPRVAPNGEPIISQQEIRFSSAPKFSDIVNFTMTAKMLIADAYHLPAFSKAQIAGGPDWIDQAMYQVHAKIDDQQYAAMQKMPTEQRVEQTHLMEQALLASRFQLKVHFETRDLPVYALQIAKGGPKLTSAKTVSAPADGAPPAQLGNVSLTGKGDGFEVKARSASPAQLILFLQQQPELGNRMVIDKTGLTARYDMLLRWTREGSATADTGAAPMDAAPSFFTAIKEQLGLELVETKGPAEVIVIDHIEKPSVDGAEVAPAAIPSVLSRAALAASADPTAPAVVSAVGAAMSAPVLLYSVEPEFTEKARKAKASGEVLVGLWVDDKGNPTQVRTLRSLGLGLDEKAIEAVKQYRYKPAMENGKPVPAQLSVVVKFQVF